MSPRKLTMSPAFLATIRGLRELHHLTVEGRLDSPEADAIRDAADAPWEALSGLEKKRISGLSEDLYSITDPAGNVAKELNPQVQARLADIYQARQRGEWDRVFELLRRWGAYLEPSLLSYLRGDTWLEAGDPATAAIFFKHASDLQPNNENYLCLYMNTLDKFAPSEARARAEEILRSSTRNAPVVVAHAAGIALGRVDELPEGEAVQFLRQLISLLAPTLAQLEKGDGDGGMDRSAFSTVCSSLSVCHEYLGETQAALDYCSKGLAADPTNDALRIARGMLAYGKSSQAIDDFLIAARQASPLIWPYFYLAHHYVTTGQFEQARVFCERGLEKDGSDVIKSELAEWLAIARSELGFPADLVRGSFELSIQYDPSNERARRNLAAFETATQPIQPDLYETRSSASARALGLSERRMNRAA